jgi:cytochrome c-type biogenesis protein CcmH/NrfG
LIAAVLIDPMEAQAHAAVGQLYIDTGRYPDAVAALNRALELKPAAFEIRYALATALIRAGNASEGARQMELFERARRAADEQRRRDIADEVERAERPRVR